MQREGALAWLVGSGRQRVHKKLVLVLCVLHFQASISALLLTQQHLCSTHGSLTWHDSLYVLYSDRRVQSQTRFCKL